MLRSFCHGTVFGDRQGAQQTGDRQGAQQTGDRQGAQQTGDRQTAGAPAVVALHGWGRQRDDLAAVVAGYDALSLDLPGFGASPPPPEAWGSPDYAKCVSQVLHEAAGDEPVVLVGHSFGGRVAVCLAAAHPEQVRGLALTGVPLLRNQAAGAKPPLGYRLVRAANRAHLISDDRLEQARQRHGSEDYRNASGVVRDVLVRLVNEDYAEELGQLVRAPVELVWGEGDTAAPLEVARRAEQILAAAGAPVHLVVEAGGDDSPIRQPEALRQAIDRLLATPTR